MNAAKIICLGFCLAGIGSAATAGSPSETDSGPDLHVLRAENAMLKRLVGRLQKEVAALRAENKLLKAALPDSGSSTTQKSKAADAKKGVQTFTERLSKDPFREPIKIGAIGYIGKATIQQVVDKTNAVVEIKLGNTISKTIRSFGRVTWWEERKKLTVWLSETSTTGWTDGVQVNIGQQFTVVGTKRDGMFTGRTVFQLTPQIKTKPSAPPQKPSVPAAKPNRPAPGGSNITVYVTRTGSKYHRGTCRHLRKSRIPISLKNAKARGHGPCGVCRPP